MENVIQVRKEVEFTRVKNDYFGNPRYAFHYLALADEYPEAVEIAKQFGGKKFHNRAYGGGIVIQSFNLKESLQAVQMAVIDSKAGPYVSYIFDCFDEGEGVEGKIKLIQAMYKEEFGNMGYGVEACDKYLRGLGGFNHAFNNAEIEILGRERFKVLRKNASSKSVCEYVDSGYWDELAKALQALLSIEFV